MTRPNVFVTSCRASPLTERLRRVDHVRVAVHVNDMAPNFLPLSVYLNLSTIRAPNGITLNIARHRNRPFRMGKKHGQRICGERPASLCLYSHDAWTDKLLIKGLGAIYIRHASSILLEQGARRSCAVRIQGRRQDPGARRAGQLLAMSRQQRRHPTTANRSSGAPGRSP